MFVVVLENPEALHPILDTVFNILSRPANRNDTEVNNRIGPDIETFRQDVRLGRIPDIETIRPDIRQSNLIYYTTKIPAFSIFNG